MPITTRCVFMLWFEQGPNWSTLLELLSSIEKYFGKQSKTLSIYDKILIGFWL